MRAILQRVSSASVTVDCTVTGSIQAGIVVLLGVHRDDDKKVINWLVDKIINLRFFEDGKGKMNLSLLDTGGSLLVVSQFTLYGDCRKGRRPGYSTAAPPEKAKELYLKFIKETKNRDIPVECGTFQAHMQLELVNDGPVTLLLDSSKLF